MMASTTFARGSNLAVQAGWSRISSLDMPLTTGTRLGQYEILGPLGAGGMGEVYRARDTKLNRDVAVTVLPEAVANDRERLARFAREPQALAALNHPNIATIYGVDDSATQAIVMELVEGLALAELMTGAVDRAPSGREPRPAVGSGRHGTPRKVPLPLNQVLAIADRRRARQQRLLHSPVELSCRGSCHPRRFTAGSEKLGQQFRNFRRVGTSCLIRFESDSHCGLSAFFLVIHHGSHCFPTRCQCWRTPDVSPKHPRTRNERL